METVVAVVVLLILRFLYHSVATVSILRLAIADRNYNINIAFNCLATTGLYELLCIS